MKAIGLDIGTTTICGILMDAGSGELMKRYTLPNDAGVSGGEAFERQQDPARILELCQKLIADLMEGETKIAGIGVTGQMHGILYLDREGKAVSPLITWQDQRGNQLCPTGCRDDQCPKGNPARPAKSERTYAEVLAEYGGRLAAGFGAVTHFYNTRNGKIPLEAVCFCTIPDYVALRLTDKKQPLLHASMAASLGMFRLKEREFDREGIEKAGMDGSYFPKVAKKEQIIGLYQGKIPVSLAFGDNQASFLGAVEKGSRVLVNVGTGSQVSVLGSSPKEFAAGSGPKELAAGSGPKEFAAGSSPKELTALECRPYLGESCLYVGSSLCGGSAYAMLERFFEETMELLGEAKPGSVSDTNKGQKAGRIYEKMAQAGRKARQEEARLLVDTRFMGTREQPWIKGSISEISADNFKPGTLVLGVLEGICRELLEYYTQMTAVLEQEEASSFLTGSGNGIRRNALLRELFCEFFHMPVRLSPCEEEAAYGSARFLLYCLEECHENLEKRI